MKVTFSGSQSVGKSTLIEDLMLTDFAQEHNFQWRGGTTRTAKYNGFPINENGTNETQMHILTHHILNHEVPGNVFYDRCALDGYIYTTWLYDEDKVVYPVQQMSKLLNNILSYDLQYYIPPEIPLEDDGARSASEKWRQEIHERFKNFFKNNYDIPILTGTREERVAKVISDIKSYMEK